MESNKNTDKFIYKTEIDLYTQKTKIHTHRKPKEKGRGG